MRYVRHRAMHIQKTLGTKAAAGYLRNMGVSLEGALATLVLPKTKELIK